MNKYILAMDAGTTSCRSILFDQAGRSCDLSQREFPQIYPQTGWVEHDPMQIWGCQVSVTAEVLARNGAQQAEVAAIGITNQRETTIVWNKYTGEPVYNAIVWQCRRTADRIEQLKKDGLEEYVHQTTGLIADAYFSASKIAWILDRVPGARQAAQKGQLLFGTVDSWLIWKLTGGKVHVTDRTNASRTMLYDIHHGCWDEKLLDYFGIPISMMPQVRSSSEIYGYTDPGILGSAIPIAGAAGDQQAALFGQCCFEEGEVKNTYGTGCFLLMNTGDQPVISSKGLLTTIAAAPGDRMQYALEGSIFAAGAAIQWIRDEMQLIRDASETEALAGSVPDTNGVYFVPAFTGLGAPYWDPYARGTAVGITRGCKRSHFVRAVLESLAYQTYDVLKVMEEEAGRQIHELRVDGGASMNGFLMQFQADILGCQVLRPAHIETTALGAAYLAGLAVGFWTHMDQIRQNCRISQTYESSMQEEDRGRLLRDWHRAVQCSRGWIERKEESDEK